MSNSGIHFNISERKVLLRIFDVLSILLVLYIVSNWFDFDYFTITKVKWTWVLVLILYVSIFGTVFELYDLQKSSKIEKIATGIVFTGSTTVLFYLLTPFFTPALPDNRFQILFFYFAILIALFLWRTAYITFIVSPRFYKKVLIIGELILDQYIFSETIGKIGLQVEPSDYSWLIRLYWFTIEFGLLKQNGVYKALGSGLNSSPTELIYSVDSPVPERREFNVIDILRTPYRIDIHQPIYYVIDEIDDLLQVAERDLQSDIKKAQSLGLFEKTFNPINETKRTA